MELISNNFQRAKGTSNCYICLRLCLILRNMHFTVRGATLPKLLYCINLIVMYKRTIKNIKALNHIILLSIHTELIPVFETYCGPDNDFGKDPAAIVAR